MCRSNINIRHDLQMRCEERQRKGAPRPVVRPRKARSLDEAQRNPGRRRAPRHRPHTSFSGRRRNATDGASPPLATVTDLRQLKPLFDAYAAQDTTRIWNIHISDQVVSPSTRRTVGRGHGKM
jgi:hypothetical protein